MSRPITDHRASLLLVEECFAREDEGFLQGLRLVSSPKWLAAFADRWKTDSRPWARARILEYLEQPLDSLGHAPLVKRLFKHAEAQHDNELLGAFLVAFDCSVRRVRANRWTWDPRTRKALPEQVLVSPHNALPNEALQVLINPKTGARTVLCKSGRRLLRGRLFSYRTRHYLRRRVWRYFRSLGHGKPVDYVSVASAALRRYRDSDLEKGENILDSRSLLNICFHGCEVLEFTDVHVKLKEGRSLSELRAAPRFKEAWYTPDSGMLLLGLLQAASAKLVRLWALDLFRQVSAVHKLDIPAETVLALVEHSDESVQALGAQLLETHTGLAVLPLATWLRFLRSTNFVALPAFCAAFEKHVAAQRLSVAECVALACLQPVPVARLGQRLLLARTLSPADQLGLADIADAQCTVVAAELSLWVLGLLGTREAYEVSVVCRFFDSLSESVREVAWTWLLRDGCPAYDDPVLWSRLSETPFDDLRLKLVDLLARRATRQGLGIDQLAPVWCSVLLGVHRGGRSKLKAVREIAESIAINPSEASRLLPVLAVAVRSVRGPEMRAGLAAVMSLVVRRPELSKLVATLLPELKFTAGELAR